VSVAVPQLSEGAAPHKERRPFLGRVAAAVVRFLLGGDLFVSYARADGSAYALALANALSDRGFVCYVDQWGSPPDKDVPARVRRILRRSSALVVVGSEEAAASKNVNTEVSDFRKTGRSILVIDVDDKVGTAIWAELVRGVARIGETKEGLEGGKPPGSVVQRIESAARFTRRSERQRRLLIGSTALFALIVTIGIAASSYFSGQARASRNLADRTAATVAEDRKQAEQLQKNIKKLQLDTKVLEDAKAAADDRAAAAKTRADGLEGNLRDKTTIARSRQLAAAALEQRREHLDLALLLAVEAWRMAPTDEARAALLATLADNPQLATYLHVHPDGIADRADDVAFAADGKLLVIAYPRGVIRVWDVDARKILGELPDVPTDLDLATKLTVSPDGALVATNGKARPYVWRLPSRTPVPLKAGDAGPFYDAAFAPRGSLLAGRGPSKTQVWKPDSGELAGSCDESAFFESTFAWAADGRRMLQALGYYVGVWDAETPGNDPVPFDSDQSIRGVVQSLAASADGRWYAISYRRSRTADPYLPANVEPGRVRLGALAGLKPITEHILPFQDATTLHVEFSRDSALIGGAANDRSVRIWRVVTASPLYELRGHGDVLYTFAFSPQAKGIDDDVRALEFLNEHWDAAWQKKQKPRSKAAAEDDDDDAPNAGAAERDPADGARAEAEARDAPTVFDDGATKRLVATAGRDTAILWNAIDPRRARRARFGSEVLAGPRPRAIAIDRHANVVTYQGWVVTLDAKTGAERNQADVPIQDAEHPQTTAPVVALSPDGRYLALSLDVKKSSNTVETTEVKVWDVEGKRFVASPFKAPGFGCSAMAFDRTGDHLACAQPSGGIIYGTIGQRSRPVELSTDDIPIEVLAFAPDGKSLAGFGKGEKTSLVLVRHDSPHAPVVQPLVLRGPVTALAFTPDGQEIVGSAADQLFEWKAADLAKSRSHRLPKISTSLAVAPDGALVVVGLDDGGIVLFDRKEWQRVGPPLEIDKEPIGPLVFSRDGGQIVFAGSNIGALDVSPSRWCARACAVAHRSLSAAEWADFVSGPYKKTCPEF